MKHTDRFVYRLSGAAGVANAVGVGYGLWEGVFWLAAVCFLAMVSSVYSFKKRRNEWLEEYGDD